MLICYCKRGDCQLHAVSERQRPMCGVRLFLITAAATPQTPHVTFSYSIVHRPWQTGFPHWVTLNSSQVEAIGFEYFPVQERPYKESPRTLRVARLSSWAFYFLRIHFAVLGVGCTWQALFWAASPAHSPPPLKKILKNYHVLPPRGSPSRRRPSTCPYLLRV